MESLSTDKRIIIIDDSKPLCLLLEQLLQAEGYHTTCYHSAEEFLQLRGRTPSCHMFILDINLPDMDGLELAGQLRSDPSYASLPILLLSGDSRKETVIRGMRQGAQDYIVKPIDPEQLLERVHALLY